MEQLIQKHLGINTPQWLIDNCKAMLNEWATESVNTKEKELTTHGIITRFISQKDEEYIGKYDYDRRIMLDWNGVNVITEDENGDVVSIVCVENM